MFFFDEDDRHASRIGARGIGELGEVGVAAAITNAIFHANRKAHPQAAGAYRRLDRMIVATEPLAVLTGSPRVIFELLTIFIAYTIPPGGRQRAGKPNAGPPIR